MQTADREIVSARLFRAPPERLFDACVDAGSLAQWWGPRGFTNTILELDPRPGGRWRSIMHAPDGTDFQIVREFVEVAPPRRLVVRHMQDAHSFTTIMTFDERKGATLLTWRMLFDLASEAARVKSIISAANEENFDRLQAHLAAGQS